MTPASTALHTAGACRFAADLWADDGRAPLRVLDLFSAAAGGWSLGLHRAGFQTVAACEWIDWRRTLYAENNPGVLIYDDVRTLTGERLLADLGTLPDIVVGSPPCQDISSANTKGKGVDGERSGLFFEAVRIIGEVRPRWFALENSANLRTRGADRVLGTLESHNYACWAAVVGGDNIRANHERKRSWLIGVDLDQLAYAYRQLPDGRTEQPGPQGQRRGVSRHGAAAGDFGGADGPGPVQGRPGGLAASADAAEVGRAPRAGTDKGQHAGIDGCLAGHDADDGDARHADRQPGAAGLDASAAQRAGHGGGGPVRPDAQPCGDDPLPSAPDVDAAGLGHEGRRARRHGPDGNGASPASGGPGDASHADQAGQPHGPMVAGLRQEEVADDGCGAGRGDDRPGAGQVGLCEADRRAAFQHRADWSLDDLARHIRLDDGLPAWLAEQRVAVGGPRGTSAASLVVEAFGDSVLPQIPEAIGRAILRVEAAYAALTAADQRAAA